MAECSSMLPSPNEYRRVYFGWPDDIQPKEAIFLEELFKLQIATIHKIASNNIRRIDADAEYKSWMTANVPASALAKG